VVPYVLRSSFSEGDEAQRQAGRVKWAARQETLCLAGIAEKVPAAS
jgi:hypothetical protein